MFFSEKWRCWDQTGHVNLLSLPCVVSCKWITKNTAKLPFHQSPICQEGQSEKTFLISALSSRFLLFSPHFSWFSPSFSWFLAIFLLSGVALCPLAPPVATPLHLLHCRHCDYTVTVQWLDSGSVVIGVICRQHGDYRTQLINCSHRAAGSCQQWLHITVQSLCNQGRIHVWSESAPAPPFLEINHANSAYFRLFLGYFGVISATRPPPFWISASPFYISWIRPW